MNSFSKLLAATLIAGVSTTGISTPVAAATRHHHYRHYYHHRTRYRRCRYSSGTTGLVVGGVAGAVAGPSIIGHGVLGAAAGAVGGALAGRAIDRTTTAPRRCR